MNTLFIMEEWCDCNPACGTSGTDEYYLKTYRSLNIGPAFVVHYDCKPVHETVARCLSIADRNHIDMVFYTECGGIPSAQVHELWPIFASRGIPVVAIWHDSQGGIVRDLNGVACNVIVDTRTSWPRIRGAISLWVPHHTDLFYDDGRERPYDVIFPSSRHTKSTAAEYVSFLTANGINVHWAGGQREDRLSWFEYAEQYRHGKICLNFPRNSPERLPQVKSRVTEALYSGCCLFEHGSEHMTDMLVDGKEYVSFTTKEDCLSKIDHLLKQPDQLRDIARAGRERANRDYSPWRWWSAVISAVNSEKCITGMYD
jgi:hypothetical protein